MTDWPRTLAGALVAAVVALTAGTTATSPAAGRERRPVPHHRLLTLADPAVLESSGLVDRGGLLLTINDSGDGPVVYGIDPRTGATVSRTTYSTGTVEDVEALAPGAHGALWVGDIGDNRGSRDGVDVYRVVPRDGGRVSAQVPSTRYRLTYPDGARDAEALLVQPRTGRLLVVSKSVFGGTVYLAPRHLSTTGANRLRPFARVDGLVTDGAFFPDGRHVVLRTYGDATVYTYPDFRPVGTVRLPSQPQGEGISVGRDGRVLLSSEGVHADVLEVTLPARLTATSPSPGASPVAPSPSPAPTRGDLDPPSTAAQWWRVGAVGVVLLVLLVLVTRLSRVRGPR